MGTRIFGSLKSNNYGIETTAGDLSRFCGQLAETLPQVIAELFPDGPKDLRVTGVENSRLSVILLLAFQLAFKMEGYKSDSVREYRVLRAGHTPINSKLIAKTSILDDEENQEQVVAYDKIQTA